MSETRCPNTCETAPLPHGAPSMIGQYRVTGFLGSGGMGDVWLGLNEYGNEVAIKQFCPGRVDRPRLLRRFLREGEVLSRLRHRNICRIHSVEQVDGRPFIVMEYVRGVSLASLLYYLATPTVDEDGVPAVARKGDIATIVEQVAGGDDSHETSLSSGSPPGPAGMKTLPLRQALSIFTSLCEAVQYAHEHGVFHRDIKPSNIILRGDGEPVLLDFGVAKLVGDQVREQLTITGQLFGTFEYMAPEQAQSGKAVDERADVYSLGALLYELLTGKPHFVPTNSIVTDVDLLSTHIPKPPSKLARGIDPDLDAVVLKALRPDPAARYRSVMHLGSDVRRYSEGRPVTAKPPTPWYRAARFVRRNRLRVTLSAMIAALVLAIGLYVGVDHYRRWGAWRRVLAEDFTDGHYDARRFSFVGKDRHETAPWVCDSAGLIVRNTEWCRLRDVRLVGDVRLVVRLRYGGMPDGFEAVINAADDNVDQWWYLPRGYGCQVGGYNGTLDFVTISRTPDVARVLGPGVSQVESGATVEVIFQRKGKDIELWVDGRLASSQSDLLPFVGPQFGGIGFRSYAPDVRVLSLEVYHMALPEKTSPLMVGHALASLGHTREAVAAYRRLADDHSGTRLEERALFHALVTADELPSPHRVLLLDSLRSVFGVRYPHSPLWREIREDEMVTMWRHGRFGDVLTMLPDHFKRYPATRIALRLASTGALIPPPESARERLFAWVCRTKDATAVDASGLPPSVFHLLADSDVRNLRWQQAGLSDVSALAQLQLQWLVVDHNRIADVGALHGQPLRYIDIASNFVKDLEPLAGTALISLIADYNDIRDLSPLRVAPVRVLHLAANRIEDLSPLRDMPLERLSIDRNRISDLSCLEGLRLTALSCRWNRIEDFSPLRGMPLEELSCGFNGRIDLDVLGGMPLRSLSVVNMGLRDLSAVASLPITDLTVSRNPLDDVSPVVEMELTRFVAADCSLSSAASFASMRALRELNIAGNRITDLRPLAPLELTVLNCSDNPLQSLDPFVHDPPPTFVFLGMHVDSGALASALDVWSRQPKDAHLARQARVCLALQRGDGRELRRIATRMGGHRYLYIPLNMYWSEADSVCRRYGGHTVTIESVEEERLVRRLRKPVRPIWLGVRPGGAPVEWVTGEPIDYWQGRIDRWSEYPWAYGEGPATWGPGNTACLVIEWDT